MTAGLGHWKSEPKKFSFMAIAVVKDPPGPVPRNHDTAWVALDPVHERRNNCDVLIFPTDSVPSEGTCTKDAFAAIGGPEE